MATDRQIEANRRNSARSSGPTSEAGKARSRANSTKHGMAGESAVVEAGLSAEFAGRRARWAAEHQPVGEAGGWALDRAVAASLRIERCERALEELTGAGRERARLAWDQDRAIEAATIFGRLARDPVLASRQLEASLAGVELLVEAWVGLVATLQGGEDWSEAEASRALDLLGVAPDLRSGRSPIDGPEGSDPVAFRRTLALGEVDRLEELGETAMAPLDAMERRLAMRGDVALLSRPAKLVLRYERDAWRRYRESIREVQDPATPPVVVAPAPVPLPAVAHPSTSIDGGRRAPLGVAAPVGSGRDDRPGPMGPDERVARIDEYEQRLEVMPEARGRSLPLAEAVRAPATERTQLGGGPVASSPSMAAGR